MARKAKVVITHWVHSEVVERLTPSCDVVTNQTSETLPRQEILQRAKDAQAMMVFMPDRIDRAFLEACPQLKVVAGALRGYDNFDLDACTQRQVWFTIVPDLLAAPTAELTVGLLIGLARRLLEGDALIRQGRFKGWQPQLYSTGLANRTLGIVGMGKLGQALAKRIAGFDMKLVYSDPVSLPEHQEATWDLSRVSLRTLLSLSDFVVLMVPLTPDTFHLVNRTTLAQMKPGSFVINSCRGSVVDEQAIAKALASGHLGGYAADVFAMEDWARADRPHSIPDALRTNQTQTFFTPHLGSAVDQIRRDIALEAATSILQALERQIPQGAVNHIDRSAW